MTRIVLISLLCFFYCTTSGQKKSPELNLQAINYSLMEDEFIARLNKLRGEMKLNVLQNDNTLAKAAEDQAKYQKEKHLVTHDQLVKGKEKPQKRVFFYNGTHEFVGENCIKIPLKIAYKTKYSKQNITVITYADAGEALYMGWKNSAGHYKNMIEPGYEVYGLGFSFDKDSSNLYCTQVFAAKQFIFSSDMASPSNAFGVKEALSQSCSMFNTMQAKNALKSLEIVQMEDSIFLRSEEAGLLMKFFNKADDAIYFDLVQRRQFICETRNSLHGSPIFDGKMLEPILFKDIFKRSRIKDGKNMYAAICASPKQLKDKNIRLNFGFVKNGFSCEYTYLVRVPEKNLVMLDLYPKWIYFPELEVKPDSFDGNLSFTIPFERNEVKPNEKKTKQLNEKLEIYKPFITHVDLQTFSSVEGNAQTNLKLQEQRAANIMSIVKNYYTDSLTIKTQTDENWDDFFALIENTEVAYLKALSKEKIKEKLKSRALLDSLDFLLRTSRIAKLTIGLKAKIDNESNPYLILAAYKKSIEQQDSLKAFHNQNKLLEHVTKLQFESRDILPIQIPLSRKFLPHLTNYLAISIKDDEMMYSNEARNLAVQASKIDTNYLPLKFNLCIISLKYMQDYNDTIIKPAELERKMTDCFKLGTAEDSIIANHMWLNYSILSVYTNWRRHLYHNIDRHLANIKKYYPGAKINETEAIQLGKLFNLYSRTDWTCELLLPYLKNKSKNEDLLFLFNETYASRKGNMIVNEEYSKYLKKAKKQNPARFNRWIDEENFQLLRNDLIKKEFCNNND